MFKTLYRCARTAARHESGPAAKSRLAYLEHLAAGGSSQNIVHSTWHGREKCERFRLKRQCESWSPTSTNMRWRRCWPRRIGQPHTGSAIMHFCCSSTTRAHAPVKPPIYVSPIWNLICDSHSPQVYASWGRAGRCDDAPSGKRPRWNWSNSSRTDHRNSGSS